MKKVALIIFVLVMSTGADAQIRDLMKEKAAGVIKNKQQEKNQSTTATDTSTTKTASGTTQQTTQQNTQQTGTQQGFGNYGVGAGSKSDVKATYTFNDNMLVEITNYKKDGTVKKDEATKIRYHFSKEKYFGSEMTTTGKKPEDNTYTFSIVESEKNHMVMLTESKDGKTGMVIKVQPKTENSVADTSKSKTTVTKTGKTKVILGYKCEEYVSVDEKGNKSEIWITTALALDASGSAKMFGGKKNDYDMTSYPQGAMLEMTHYAASGEKTTWRVLEINLNSEKVVKTGDYTFYGF